MKRFGKLLCSLGLHRDYLAAGRTKSAGLKCT
jgi:hypothetical protein